MRVKAQELLEDEVDMTDRDQRERTELERLRLLVLAAQRDGARRLTDSLREARLSPAQAEILGVLAESGPMTLSDLGRRIVCESGSPSRTVDLLVRRGLVDRVQRPDDRRYVELALTEDGRGVLPLIVSGVAALDRDLAAALTPAEREQVNLLLSRVLAGTEALDAIELRCGRIG